MSVPKATMNKNYFLPTGENKVRRAGQILSMQAKPEPKGMNQSSDGKFGFRVLGSDRPHRT